MEQEAAIFRPTLQLAERGDLHVHKISILFLIFPRMVPFSASNFALLDENFQRRRFFDSSTFRAGKTAPRDATAPLFEAEFSYHPVRAWVRACATNTVHLPGDCCRRPHCRRSDDPWPPSAAVVPAQCNDDTPRPPHVDTAHCAHDALRIYEPIHPHFHPYTTYVR